MLLDVCIYVLCMYGSSLWVYTRPRAGLNSIGLRGVLAFEVCPATSRSNCHSHQVVNFFSFIFKYFQTMSSSNFVRGQFSFCKCGPRESRLGCQQKNLISVKVCKYLQAPSPLDPALNDATLMTRALIKKKLFEGNVRYFENCCKIISNLQNAPNLLLLVHLCFYCESTIVAI